MILLFASTFGKNCSKIRKNCIPIEVGAANRSNFIYPTKDNKGDNISKENPYFGELTGLYWIWKNYKFSDDYIVGFCHYNKYLNISDEKIKDYLSRNRDSWICLSTVKMPNHTYPEDIKVLMSVLEKEDSKYIDAWNQLYNIAGGG